MALVPLAGNKAKVTLATTTVLGIGNWKLNGITVDLLETTSFGDTAKGFITGLLDYGSVTFGGIYDVADSTGQTLLASACDNNSKISVLRLYVNNTSYWCPDTTTLATAGVYVQSYSIGFDKAGLGTIEFTAKATGPFKLI